MSSVKPKIKILFVEARYFDTFILPTDENLSLYILATFLRDNLPQVDFEFDFAQSHNYSKYADKNSYDLCGVYSTTQAWNQACKIASKMRRLGTITIVGGPHITSLPKSLSSDFEVGCIGPGELVLKRLVKIYSEYKRFPISELAKVNSVVFHYNGELQINIPSNKKINLDNLPSPYKYYLKPNNIRTNLLSSMGCPHNCFFCAAKVICPTLRMRSAECIVEEIQYLHNNYNISSFKFVDDNFLASRKRLENIIKLLEKIQLLGKIKISCTSSSKLINEDTANILQLLSCEYVAIGLESGSEAVLKKLKQGNISLQDHENALKLLNDRGIKISGTFILGTPGESIDDVKKTLMFIKSNKIHNISAYLIKPLPGTQFWNELVDKGKLDPYNILNFQELALTNLDPKWYFNESMEYVETIRYLKLINRIGLYRTIKCNLMSKLLYQAIYRQSKLLVVQFINNLSKRSNISLG